MIRINLLGSPKPKSKKGAAISMPSMDFNIGSPMMIGAAVIVIAALANAGYWYMLDRQKKAIAGEGIARWRQPVGAPKPRGDLLRHIDAARDEQRLQIQDIHHLAVEIEGSRRRSDLFFFHLPEAGC